MTSLEKQPEKVLLSSLSVRRIGKDGFNIVAVFGDEVVEENVTVGIPKLKKFVKRYIDELKEDLHAN